MEDMSLEKHPRCGCDLTCGDLPEEEDDPMATCKQLPLPSEWIEDE